MDAVSLLSVIEKVLPILAEPIATTGRAMVSDSRMMNQSTNMSLSSVNTSTQQNRSMFLSPTSIGSLASPTAAMGAELDLHWDPEAIRSELHAATIVLSQRCLKLAAKWASEQLLGLPWSPSQQQQQQQQRQQQQTQEKFEPTATPMTADNQAQMSMLLQETDPYVLYAKSLMELGEYMHAAAVLSLPNTIVTSMAPPLPQLSSYGIFLRAYALFLAGERRKEEDYIELQR